MQKVAGQAKTQFKTLNKVLKNDYTVLPSSNVKHFETLQELKSYLHQKRPVRHAIYANSSWNPMCEQAEKDFSELSHKYHHYEFLSFNSEENIQAKKYFDVKCEPEFIIMNLGSEMTRQTGQSKEALIEKFERVDKHFSSLQFLPGTDNYENFEDNFMEEYEHHDYEFDWWAR